MLGKFLIPKKRTKCVICYDRQIFQTEKDLRAYMQDTKQMSTTVIDYFFRRLPTVESESTMRKWISLCGYNEANVERLMSGSKPLRQK